MIRASFIAVAVLLVFARNVLAAEITKTSPAPFDGILVTGPATAPDFTNITLKIDTQYYTKPGISLGGNAVFFIHQVKDNPSVAVTGCVAVNSTSADPVCSCNAVQYIPAGGGAAVLSGFVSAAGAAPNGQPGTPTQAVPLGSPIYIWQAFCAAQYAKGQNMCTSAAQTATTTPCNTVTISASNASNNGSSLAPNVVTVPPAGGANGTTPKAGASMTTSQVTVLTIGPLAMLAVANFVV